MQSIDDILKEMGGKACSAPLPKVKPVGDEGGASIESFRAWIRDSRGVSNHLKKFDLEKKLGPRDSVSNRVVKLRNVLPSEVALGALAVLKKAKDWEVSDASYDTGKKEYGAGSTQHRFSATAGNNETTDSLLQQLYNALGQLLPGKTFAFQGGKYGSGDFIEAHDDAAYIDAGADGEQVLHSRSIAIVYYLCKNWTPNDGGAFVDLQEGQAIYPEFNTLVAFHVPRLHLVEPVRTQLKFRYSVFGWFLEEGKLYDLMSAPEGQGEQRKKKRNKHKKKHGQLHGEGRDGKKQKQS